MTTIADVFTAHGVDATLAETKEGPQVTRHLFTIDKSTKVAKALALDEEIEMALDVDSVSIERKGKHVIVDVPRTERMFVDWEDRGNVELEFYAGLDLQGDPVTIDLAAAPHMLIAGSTGSGKSVAINAILTDWLKRLDHEQIRVHLVDPKRVELGQYRDLPQVENFAAGGGYEAHYVIDMVMTIMLQRFDRFEAAGVRDIGEYNEQVEGDTPPMPFQVLVVDEFADLMLGDKTIGKEIEEMVVRIAQLGRAAGVHMLLATQRPSAQVFTGLIKANVPARWVFRVNTGLDSRIALDQHGAEELLGKGDGLLQIPGEPIVRVQSAASSKADHEDLVEFGLRVWSADEHPVNSLDGAVLEEFEDDLHDEFGLRIIRDPVEVQAEQDIADEAARIAFEMDRKAWHEEHLAESIAEINEDDRFTAAEKEKHIAALNSYDRMAPNEEV